MEASKTSSEDPPFKSEEEMAELQKMSAEYQPDTKGPLVSEKLSSDAIAVEYAWADPVYIEKTMHLHEKFSHYRTVRGDGNCGWRAIAFCYMEALAQAAKGPHIATELDRLLRLNSTMEAVGWNHFTTEDFVEETVKVLTYLLESIDPASPEAAERILSVFADPETSDAIVTHFRLLTSAHMRLNPDEYAPFIENPNLEIYCNNVIEPFTQEIDHVGMKALIDTIILPAGLQVEIMYLDRSEGQEVNVHSFKQERETPSDLATEEPLSVIRLLYRP